MNDVELPANPTTVQYVITTNGEQLDVRDSNNDYHKFADPNTELIYADYDLVHNIIMPYDANKALWLYHDWRVFTGFVANEFGKTMDLDLNVRYEEGEFIRGGYHLNNHEITFQGDGLMNNGNAVLDEGVVFHEFSHHLMNEAYNDYFASYMTYPLTCADESSHSYTHFIHEASDGECAFSEGFADMMPHLIMEETVIEVESYDYTFDIESPAYWDGDDMEDIAEGVTVEGRVAAAMFDLLDRGNARDEDVTEDGDDFWEVFEIFKAKTATDIEDFYENWKDTHGYDSDLDEVYELNTLSAVLTSQEVTEIGDPVSSSTRIVLNWNATVTGAPTTFYEVLRATSPFVSIANVTSTTYVDEDVLPSTAYRYKIVPHSDHGPGLPSRIINASTTADNASLIISAPSDITVEATGILSTIDIGTATATDSQDPSPAIINDAPDAFPLGTTTVTWTATNNAGNSVTATQTVTVRDTTPPSVTAPAAYTAEATGAMTELGTDDYGTATATDLVDSDPEITSDAPASFPIGITTITWTATDDSGNSATATQAVTVRATVSALTITAPADHVAEATGVLTPLNATDYGTATATDPADPDPEVTSDAPDAFPLGDTIIAWTATNDSGNSVTAAQTVTVRDTTPPVIEAPDDLPVAAHAGSSATVSFDVPDATDLADPDVAVSCTPEPGSAFASGATAVTCTATDSSGNSARTSFEVRVGPFDVIHTVSRTVTGGGAVWNVTGPGLVLAGGTYEYAVTLVNGTAPSNEALAVYSGTATVDDLGPYEEGADCPVAFCIGFPGQLHASHELDNHGGSPYDTRYHVITAAGPGHVIMLQVAGSAPAGSHVAVGLMDRYGGIRGGMGVSAVEDTAPPALSRVPQDMTFVVPAGGNATASFGVPEAADDTDPDPAVSCAPESGSAFAPGTTEVTCTAADSSGNESQASFKVRVASADAARQASARGTHGGAGWTVTGPGLVFPGGTYEYTVTLDKGTAPPNEALSMHSDTSGVDDFGLHVRIQDCPGHFCAGFPGPTHAVRQLENPGGSAYDHYLQPVSASDGPVRTITLEVGDSAPAGGRVGIGLLDAGRNVHVGVQATVVDPAVPLAADPGGRLVSHLAFEGDVRDSAGGSHGTIHGTASYADGAVGRAFHFDGSTHVTLAEEGSFDFERTDPFSAAFWLKRDGPDDRNYYILAKKEARDDLGPSAWIWEVFPGRIHFGFGDGTAYMGVNTMGANLTDGAWHHVAFTYDGSNTRGGLAAYVDGIEGSDRRMALSLNGTTTNDEPLTLGALGSGREAAREAAMDELRVYSRELTASEAFALYAEGAG